MKLPNPCFNCTQRHAACHDNCRKYQVYIKIKAEIKRRIAENFRQNDRRLYKPAVRQMCLKK